MIVSRDIAPGRQIYYLGAVLIRIIGEQNADGIDIQQAFADFSEQTGCGVDMFFIALDWLYLMQVVREDRQGLIRCF